MISLLQCARQVRGRSIALAALCTIAGGVSYAPAHASELVSLKNGFDLVCDHRVTVGDRVRLYPAAGSDNFVEFGSAEIASIEPAPSPQPEPLPVDAPVLKTGKVQAETTVLTRAELHEMLAEAGARHNLDADLLASVVHAESGGRVRAVSRTGARGLMQLMAGTAAEVGVSDSFRPEENIRGGTAYLDSLLTKYGDNLALALAAYNAGPAAVARWHGVPPYRETRAYVARVIREFNARRPADTRATIAAAAPATAPTQTVASR